MSTLDWTTFSEAALAASDGRIGDDVRRRAVAFIGTVRDHPDGWRFCAERLFDAEARDEARFACLQVLHAAAASGRADPEVLGKALVSWPLSFLPGHADTVSAAVRNKFAQVLASFFQRRPAVEWTALFDALLAAATNSEPVLDFLLRFLVSFSEEILDRQCVSSEALAAATAIKDELRKRTVEQLAQMLYAVMETFSDSRPQLVLMALCALRCHINWVPIGLVANEQFVPLLFRFLLHPAFAEDACECVSEVISKGMDPAAKIDLIARLRLPTVAAAALAPTSSAAVDDNVTLKLAKLLTESALELLTACEKLQQDASFAEKAREASSMIDEAFPFVASFFGHRDNDVSDAIFAFIHPYVTRCKCSALKGSPCRADHIRILLPVILKKIAFPEGQDRIGFGNEDDDDEEFSEYRKRVGNVFKALVRLLPNVVAEFVFSALSGVCAAQPYADFSKAEAALFLFFSFGEGLGNAPSGATQQQKQMAAHTGTLSGEPQESYIQRALCMLLKSGISAHPHPAVLLMFFEILVRYIKNAPTGDPCFAAALAAFLGSQGIRHPLLAVRRRVTYLFQRFARALRSQMLPIVGNIVESLRDVVAVNYEVQQTFPFEDQLTLYEAFGYLVGAQPSSQLIEAVIHPLRFQLTEILDKRLFAADTPEKPWYSTLIKQHLNAITVFSKGFGLLNKGQLAQPFLETLQESIRSLQLLGPDSTVWIHVATYLHRMIETLGVLVLPFVSASLDQLILSTRSLAACTSSSPAAQQMLLKELAELLSVIGQVSSKFKEHATAPLDAALPNALALLVEFISPAISSSSPRSEESRELFDLHKQLLHCLWTVSSNSPQALLAQSVGPIAEKLLNLLLQGLESGDPVHQRQIAKVFSRFIDIWAVQARLPGFDDYLRNAVFPALMRLVVGTRANVGDAAIYQLFLEIANTLFASKAIGLPATIEQLVRCVFAPLGCNPQHVQALADALSAESPSPAAVMSVFKAMTG